MKTLIALFLFSSLSMGICSAQPILDNDLKDDENSLLWKISGNGLQHDSYLLGTMHNVVGRTFLDSISGFRKAFIAAKQVAIESDVFTQESNMRSNPPKVPKDYVFMPKDTTYAMLYSGDDFQFVDSALKKYTPFYSKYKPYFWSRMLIDRQAFDGIKNTQSTLDGFILLLGYQNNKEIHFMETLESKAITLDKLDSISYTVDLGYQARELKEELKYPNFTRTILNNAKKYYFKQELNHFRDSIIKQELNHFRDSIIKEAKMEDEPGFLLDKSKSFLFILTDTRNEEWMKNIIPMIHENSSLIAVGALHLIGANGLIAKLRSRGYNVEPMR